MHRKLIFLLTAFSVLAANATDHLAKVKRSLSSEPGLDVCFELNVAGQKNIQYLILQTQKSLKAEELKVYLTAFGENENPWFKDFQCWKDKTDKHFSCRGADDSGSFTLKRSARRVNLTIQTLSFGSPERPGPSISKKTPPVQLEGKIFDCNS